MDMVKLSAVRLPIVRNGIALIGWPRRRTGRIDSGGSSLLHATTMYLSTGKSGFQKAAKAANESLKKFFK